MFSALRQQKIAHVVLIAAKMGDGSVGHRRTGGLLFRLARHHGAIDLKAARLGDHFVEAKGFIQHFRVREEGVRYDTQLTAAVEVTGCATDQRLRRFKAGLHSVVERRVRDDHVKATGHVGEDVAGKHVTFYAIRSKRGAAGFYCRGAHVTQG